MVRTVTAMSEGVTAAAVVTETVIRAIAGELEMTTMTMMSLGARVIDASVSVAVVQNKYISYYLHLFYVHCSDEP